MPPLDSPEGENEAIMLLDRIFRPKPAVIAGRTLYAACVDQSRSPRLYADMAVPDSVEGRFEVYTLHVVLILDRLVNQGPEAARTSQGLFDAYVQALDDALREMGIGDLSVGKKMRRLGEAFFGRVKNYHAALAELPATEDLKALVKRTIYDGVEDPPLDDLIQYILEQKSALTAQELDGLTKGAVSWATA